MALQKLRPSTIQKWVMVPWLVARPIIAITEDTSGGVLVGGTVVFAVIITEDASGGVLVGGQASHTIIITEVPSGGVLAGGVAEEWLEGEYNETMEGGVLAGGAAVIAITEDTSGGVLVNGEAVVEKNETYDETMDGGALAGGTSDIYKLTRLQSYGGVVVGGEYYDGLEFGLYCGGSADYNAIFDPSIGENEWHFVARYNQLSEEELSDHNYPPYTDATSDCYIYLDDINNIIYWRIVPAVSENTFRFRGPADYTELG